MKLFYNYIKILGFLILIVFQNNSYGTHLVGGTLYYKLLAEGASANTYQITLDIYRDCSATTDFNNLVYIGVFRGDTKDSLPTINLNMVKREFVEPVLDSCVVSPPGLCYERAVYKGTIVLAKFSGGYYLSWQRCCRNGTILNIVDPLDQGMALDAFIPNMMITPNSSPVFNKIATTFICMNKPFIEDMSARDTTTENDSLVYVLATPLDGGSKTYPIPGTINSPNGFGHIYPPPHPTTNWQPPYSLTNIIGGPPFMSINSQTGIITALPQIIGQFVYSVLVYEYRNGIKISETRRDIQVNVVPCPYNAPPQVGLQNNTQSIGDTLFFYAGEDACYKFNLTDNNVVYAPDKLTISATGDLLAPGGNGIVAPYATFSAPQGQTSPVVAELCWATGCKQLGQGSFDITVTDNNDCPSPNITTKRFFFKVVSGRAVPPDVRCVSVTGANQTTITWVNPAWNKLRGFKEYVLERNNVTAWTALATITDSLQTTFIDNTALNANTQSYCYRLSTFKICPNPFVGIPGQSACSILATATPMSAVTALVEWTPPYNVWQPVAYNVWANPVVGTSEIAGTVIDSTHFTFLGCTFNGYLNIHLQDPLTGCEVISGNSNAINLVELAAPDIDLCVASVRTDDSGVDLNWDIFQGTDFLYYRVYRANTGSSNFTMITEIKDVNTINYTDFTALVDSQSYCYYVEKSDLCNRIQKTGKDCTLKITGRGEDYRAYLKWNNYSGWSPAATEVELWETNQGVPQNLIASLNTATTTYTMTDVIDEKAQYCYKVKAIRADSLACFEAWSNETCVTFAPTLYFPNAFTPNGDGKNDYFSPIGIYEKEFDLYIYSRWGTMIYHTQQQEPGWDGTYKGQPAPEGVYVFRAKTLGYKGEEIKKTGTVTLIR
jgi:gliding motility-associated-like protein